MFDRMKRNYGVKDQIFFLKDSGKFYYETEEIDNMGDFIEEHYPEMSNRDLNEFMVSEGENINWNEIVPLSSTKNGFLEEVEKYIEIHHQELLAKYMPGKGEDIKEYAVKIIEDKKEELLEFWTEEADALPSDIREGRTAFVDGKKVVGTRKPVKLEEQEVTIEGKLGEEYTFEPTEGFDAFKKLKITIK